MSRAKAISVCFDGASTSGLHVNICIVIDADTHHGVYAIPKVEIKIPRRIGTPSLSSSTKQFPRIIFL